MSTSTTGPDALTSVHLVTLGCARNEVDSEELAARLEHGGFRLVDDPEAADAVMVNTCGFIEQAKKDSIDTIMAAADLKESGRARAVVAVGCMAERYGEDLASSMDEVDAVLSFDDYGDIAGRLNGILHGEAHVPHAPRDRRKLLPLSPVDRPAAAASVSVPGHGGAAGSSAPVIEPPDLPAQAAPASGPPVLRRRLESGPMAPLKLASGCDRRCTFCAIPAFRGSYVSRPVEEVVAEARWLVEQGVREVFLVSENTSSYGKDLGDLREIERLLRELSDVDGLDWVRLSYLQPAEMRPSLVNAIVTTEKVVPYFDLSFQHAAPTTLRRMRRFGDPESFLQLLETIRRQCPTAGVRSNFITGFPGETDAEYETLREFLVAARLDAMGVFGYSDEEGTEAASLPDHVEEELVEERRSRLVDLADELMDARSAERVGESVRVLVTELDPDDGPIGRAEHQGPEVDGQCVLTGPGRTEVDLEVGALVGGTVVDAEGMDLIVEVEGAAA